MRSFLATKRFMQGLPAPGGPETGPDSGNSGPETGGERIPPITPPTIGSCSPTSYTSIPLTESYIAVKEFSMEAGVPLCLVVPAESGLYVNSDSKIKFKGVYFNMDGTSENINEKLDVAVASCSSDSFFGMPNDREQGCFYEIVSSEKANATFYNFVLLSDRSDYQIEGKTIPHIFNTNFVAKNNFENKVFEIRDNNQWVYNMTQYINPFGAKIDFTKTGGSEEYDLMVNFEPYTSPLNDIRSVHADLNLVNSPEDHTRDFNIQAKFKATGNVVDAKFKEVEVHLRGRRFYSPIPRQEPETPGPSDPTPGPSDPTPGPEQNDIPKVGKCSSYKPIQFYYREFDISTSMPLCLSAETKQGFYINSEADITVKGKRLSNSGEVSDLDEKMDVLVATCGQEEDGTKTCYYEISTDKDVKATIHPFEYTSYEKDGSTVNTTLIVKKQYEGQLIYKNVINAGISKVSSLMFNVINPNSYDINIEKRDDITPHINNSAIFSASDCFSAKVSIEPKNPVEGKSYDLKATVSVKGKSDTIKFKEIVVSLEPLKFYTSEKIVDNNKQEESGEPLQLSTGAIAGISVGVIVFIVIIVVCIYWFTCHKSSKVFQEYSDDDDNNNDNNNNDNKEDTQ